MGRSRQEGRLLLGHEVSRVRGSGAAGRSDKGQHGVRQPFWGPGRPGSCDGLAVGGGDSVSDQGDVAAVQVAQDGAQPDADGGIAEAGGDPQDRLLR
jgi:hypothetical protein